MKHKQAGIIFGTAISAAAIAVAIDHTRHRLPHAEKSTTDQHASQQAVIIIDEGEALPDENSIDCNKQVSGGRSVAPCSL